MFQIKQSKNLTRSIKKLIKSGRISLDKIDKTFFDLARDPFSPKLRTHKVKTRRLGENYSSTVDGDLRLIWNFDAENRMVIIALDLGGHSGAKDVYL